MSVDSICEKAIERGLDGIAVTDHVNVDSGGVDCGNVIKKLKSDLVLARIKYGNKLEISMGIELGEAHHNPPLAREIVSDEDIDFVIGSLHHHRGAIDYYYVDYDRADIDAVFNGYYEELAEMAQLGCFDVIGHINYQVRYMTDSARRRVDLSAYYGGLRKILRVIASAGKGIEINTSSLWHGLSFTLPSLEVVKMFRDEGGEIVTTGSDAHQLNFVGDKIDGAINCLTSAGFSRFAFFSKRTPRFYNV
jgi:histidinol-phosphatase (PHP family)